MIKKVRKRIEEVKRDACKVVKILIQAKQENFIS